MITVFPRHDRGAARPEAPSPNGAGVRSRTEYSECIDEAFDSSFALAGDRCLHAERRPSSGRWPRQRVDDRHLLQNRTPYLIQVAHDEAQRYGELVIPPLAERVVTGSRLRPFLPQLRKHRQRHEVCVRTYHREQPTFFAVALVVAAAAVVGTAAWYALFRGTILALPFFLVVGAAVATWGVVLTIAEVTERRRRRRESSSDSEDGDIAVGMGGAFVDGNETSRRAYHVLVFLLVVAVGAVLPSLAILLATDAREMVRFEGGFEVIDSKVSPFTSRVVQMIYVSVLSLFPALMYFQFDRQRVGTIRGSWIRSIFRMDGRMRTMADVHARYGDELNEASNNSAKSVRILGGNLSPIVVATILIALGWTVLVLQTESFDFTSVARVRQLVVAAEDASDRTEGAAAAVREAGSDAEREAALATSAEAKDAAVAANAAAQDIAEPNSGGGPTTTGDTADVVDGPAGDDGGTTDGTNEAGAPVDGTTPGTSVGAASAASSPVEEAEANAEQAAREAEAARAALDEELSTSHFQLLVPRPSAAAMAFLGAYFFAVYLVIRSYFRGDLRPKLYNQITARLVTVVVVAYLISVLLVDSEQQTLLWVTAFVAGVVPRTAVQRLLMAADAVAGKVWRKSIAAGRPLTQIDGVDLYDRSVLEAEGIPDVPALANSDLAVVMMRTRLPIERLVDWADQAAMMTILNCDEERELSKCVTDNRQRGVRTATDFVAACSCGATETLDREETDAGSPEVVSVADDREVPPGPCPTCSAMMRLGAWGRIRQWRTSDLADLSRWVPLPPHPAEDGSDVPGSGNRARPAA